MTLAPPLHVAGGREHHVNSWWSHHSTPYSHTSSACTGRAARHQPFHSFRNHAAAQGAGAGDGSIRGRIADGQGAALPGVTISATSPNVGGTFSAVSDSEGNYRLINLPAGADYQVTAALEGFSRFERTGLVVRAGLNVALDISLQVGALSETLTVKGDTPLLEVFKAEQNVNISGELVRALPLTGRRDWSDVLQLAPGTLSASTDRFGGQVYFLRGSENENHVAAIDGADIGSFGQNWPSNFISLSPEALGDVQIKTGAVNASAPTAMGMVINLATRSGTDTWRGAFSVALNAASAGTATTRRTAPARSPIRCRPISRAAVPIVRDRAWFFVAERYANRKDGISRDDRQLSHPAGAATVVRAVRQ